MPVTRKRQSPPSLRDQFFRSIAAESGCHVLFDHIPGVAFFAKDRHSRLVAANRQFYERLGFIIIEDLGAYKHMEWKSEPPAVAGGPSQNRLR